MYPRISDFFNDIFGTQICLPVQSFGFFLALAFLSAYLVCLFEFRRLRRKGVFPTYLEEVEVGGPVPLSDVIFNGLLLGLVGWKLFLMFEDYEIFCDDPQGAILSMRGSIVGFLLGFTVGAVPRFIKYQGRKNDKVRVEKVEKSADDELPTFLFIAFVAGIIGAKIFHNIEYWEDFMADPIGQLVSFSGLTFYGGLIVATLVMFWYVRRRGYEPLPFADAAGMGVILAYGIGRIGCHVAGDGDWGIINNAAKPNGLSWLPDWLWKFDYPNNVLRACNPDPSYYPELKGCNFAELGRLAEPVFPTPIYETAMAVGIFLTLWFLRKRLPYWGQIFSLFLVLNGIERFLIEQIRVNIPVWGDIVQAEIIAVCMVIAGGIMFYLTTFVWKKNKLTVNIKPVKPRKKNN